MADPISVPSLYAFCLNKRSCIFVRTGPFAVNFANFAVSFLIPSDSPKNGTVKNAFLLFFYQAVPVPKWVHLAVPFWIVFRFILSVCLMGLLAGPGPLLALLQI